MIKRVKKVMLCEGRHDAPSLVEGSIFPTIIEDVTNIKQLESTAFDELNKLLKLNNLHELHLYVTGLSVALLAVINAWHGYKKLAPHNHTRLVCYHYNRIDDTYYTQDII